MRRVANRPTPKPRIQQISEEELNKLISDYRSKIADYEKLISTGQGPENASQVLFWKNALHQAYEQLKAHRDELQRRQSTKSA